MEFDDGKFLLGAIGHAPHNVLDEYDRSPSCGREELFHAGVTVLELLYISTIVLPFRADTWNRFTRMPNSSCKAPTEGAFSRRTLVMVQYERLDLGRWNRRMKWFNQRFGFFRLNLDSPL